MNCRSSPSFFLEKQIGQSLSFVPYCASSTKWATLDSSVTSLILIGFKSNGNERKQKSTSRLCCLIDMRNSERIENTQNQSQNQSFLRHGLSCHVCRRSVLIFSTERIEFNTNSDIPSVARFQTAGKGERRLWVRGCKMATQTWHRLYARVRLLYLPNNFFVRFVRKIN